MRKPFRYYIRRLHRYMGVLIGIQFLLWTFGGLYFSWSDLDDIHGDYQKAHVRPMSIDMNLANPTTILDSLKASKNVQFVHDIRLIELLGEPVYQVHYSFQHDGAKLVQLANAKTARLRAKISKTEAEAIAKAGFAGEAIIKKVEYITTTDGHHEYREQPLPAYAITIEHPSNTTVYVSEELGTIQKYRNNKWRVFDYLWMLHTMDYRTRDNISNWLLRAFSILGLITIMSGFALFWVSRKKKVVVHG